MRKVVAAASAAALLALGLSACAGGRPARETAEDDAANVRGGGVALAVLGTPGYVVGKAATCLVSALLAAPSSVALALTDRPQREAERTALQQDVGENCGPPWYLRPSNVQ